MSKFARIVLGTLFALTTVAGPAVLGAETASAKPAAKNVWCC